MLGFSNGQWMYMLGMCLIVGLYGFWIGYRTGKANADSGPRPPFDAEQFKARFIALATAAIMFALVVGVLISCGVVLVRFVLPMAR